jgi:hypothetical protein
MYKQEITMKNTKINLTKKETEVLDVIYHITLNENSIKREYLKQDDLDWLIEDARAYVDAFDVKQYLQYRDIWQNMKSVGGVLTSLQSKGLIFADETVESNLTLMQFVIEPSGIEYMLYAK